MMNTLANRTKYHTSGNGKNTTYDLSLIKIPHSQLSSLRLPFKRLKIGQGDQKEELELT